MSVLYGGNPVVEIPSLDCENSKFSFELKNI